MAVKIWDPMTVSTTKGPDYTMAFVQLAPLVTEAFAYASCNEIEKALAVLTEAKQIIKRGGVFEIYSTDCSDMRNWRTNESSHNAIQSELIDEPVP